MKSLITLCWIICLVFVCSAVVLSAPLIALTDSNKLQRIDTAAPGFILAETTVTGIQPSDAFFNDFVTRPEFGLRFGGLSNSQYVDLLLQLRNVGFTPEERNALVNGLDSGTETRATVLRKIVENDAFRQSQRNAAFVLMEYFAYLRRNPNDPPDNNFAGFTFWLNKLNSFNGDFVASEMVKAFIRSTEYKSRFGPQ